MAIGRSAHCDGAVSVAVRHCRWTARSPPARQLRLARRSADASRPPLAAPPATAAQPAAGRRRIPMPPSCTASTSRQQTADEAARQEQRLRPLPPERRRPARQGRRVHLGCTDCHGGNADDRRQGQGPRPAALSRSPGRRRPTRSAPTRCSNHESPEFIRFVNPGDLRVAHISLRHRRLPPEGSAAEPQEHDDPRLHAVGRGPLQQRRRPAQAAALRRELQHARRAAAAADRAAADARTRSSDEGRRAVPRSAAALRDQPAGQHPAHLRARRPLPARDRHPRTRSKNRAGRARA